jgi:hypothetical protein
LRSCSRWSGFFGSRSWSNAGPVSHFSLLCTIIHQLN